MLYAGTQTREFTRIHWGGENEFFDIPPFAPEPGLVQAVNQAMAGGWPLLIKGDTSLSMWAVKAICYELFGPDFMSRYFAMEMNRRFSTVEDLVYTFDHQRRKRDLEYHQLDPDNNPVKPVEEYLTRGVFIEWLEYQKRSQEKPILDIRNIHRAKEGFISDLMEFLLLHRSVKIFETGEEFEKGFNVPFVFLTADSDFKLPGSSEYHGIIYSYDLQPSRENVLENCKLQFWDLIKVEPGMEAVIERFVELFGLVKNMASVSPGSGKWPTSFLELINSIRGKWETVSSGQTTPAAILEDLETIIGEQKAILKNIDVSEIIPEVIKDIQDAEFKKAFEKLDVIQNRLPGKKQMEVNAFIIRFHDIQKQEMLGTESELILYPRRNKLMLDVMEYLKEISYPNHLP